MVSDLLLYKAEFIKDIDNKIAQSIKNIDNSDGLCIKLEQTCLNRCIIILHEKIHFSCKWPVCK